MFMGTETKTESYVRTSKLGKSHNYSRTRTYILFRCDNCGENFQRLKGSMDPKRLSNCYFHCCPNCDAKRFAQKRGVEQKKIWDMPASSMVNISRL